VKELQGEFAAPTAKQHLAAVRMLFDWLVTGHVMDTDPAHAVRGPNARARCDEARTPLAAIYTRTFTGLPDRALIGVMVYTFARINAVLQMTVDYYIQGRRSADDC
jgi:integrase/recombinase XerD